LSISAVSSFEFSDLEVEGFTYFEKYVSQSTLNIIIITIIMRIKPIKVPTIRELPPPSKMLE